MRRGKSATSVTSKRATGVTRNISKLKRPTPHPGQLANLAAHAYVEVKSVGQIECDGCGDSIEDEDVTKEDMAEYAFSRGWRFGWASDYEQPGVYCPDCQSLNPISPENKLRGK
jgi:hypothetical protein